MPRKFLYDQVMIKYSRKFSGGIILSSVIITLAVFLVDQISKILVLNFIAPSEKIAIIGDFLYLTHVQNSGAAFGILNGKTWIFFAAAIIFFGIFIYFNFVNASKSDKLERISTSLIMGGVLGNLLDRIRFLSVTDFISVKGFSVFNLADCAITIGLAILAWHVLFGTRKREEK